MKFLFTIFIYFLILVFETAASNISSVWYFGKNAGVDFNNTNSEPTPLFWGQIESYEGCATISDEAGNLLFYSNGQHIWDREHTKLNPNRIIGNPSSTMTALVPVPDNDSIYYALTVDYAGNYGLPRGFTCTHLNINMRGGKGGIFWQQDTIANEFLTEKMAITKHANGRDYWIVLHEINNNVFRSYLLTPDGIDSAYVSSSAGSIHNFKDNDRTDAIGYMKISQQGTKLALVKHEDYYLELFDFDASTGKVTNAKSFYIPHKDDVYTVYGVEFSPNGKKLYASIHKVFWVTDPDKPRQGYSYIYQWDVSKSNADSIENSKKLVYNYPNPEKDIGTFKAMQIAPDKKIYIARTDVSHLAVIAEPDNDADSCDFQLKGFYLEEMVCNSGLPNLISGLVFPLPKLDYQTPVFADETNCPESIIEKEFKIYNYGTKSVIFKFDSVKFDSDKFRIDEIIGDSVLDYRDSISVKMSFHPGNDDSGIYRDTFYLIHNDSVFIDENPITVEFVVNLSNIQTEFYDADNDLKIDTIDFGCISAGDTFGIDIMIENLSDIDINISGVVINSDNFTAGIQDSLIFQDDMSEMNLNFMPENKGYYDAELYLFTEECTLPVDTLYLKGEAENDYVLNVSDLDFGIISECEIKTDSIIFSNISKKTISITDINKKSEVGEFEILNSNFPVQVMPQDTYFIEISYNPARKGRKDSNIFYIETDLKNNYKDSVYVFGESDTINLQYEKVVDLGDVFAGQDISHNIRIVNNGKLMRFVSELEYSNEISTDINQIEMQEKDTSYIPFNFNSLSPGVYEDTMRIIIAEPCIDTLKIAVKANLINALLSVPEFVDFGDVSFCNNSPESLALANDGNTELQIDSIYINSNVFLIDNIVTPLLLSDTQGFSFDVFFMYDSANDGFNADSITVIYSYSDIYDTLYIPVTANKYSINLVYDDYITLKKNEITQKLRFDIDFWNQSGNDVFIEKIDLPEEFEILSDFIIMKAGGSEIFEFDYKTQKAGKVSYIAEITFSDNICLRKDTIVINTNDYADIIFEIENATGDIGSNNFKIPVNAYHQYPGIILNDIDYEITTSLLSDFFDFQSISGNATLIQHNYIDFEQYITIAGNIDELNEFPRNIFSINGTLLLNPEDSAKVKFYEMDLAEIYNPIGLDDFIYNNGACEQNFAVFNLLNEESFSISSDENTINLKIKNFEAGKAILQIFNLTGMRVYNDTFQTNANDEIVIPNELPPGFYNFILINEDKIITDKHLIMR